jgi:hypothetical protein
MGQTELLMERVEEAVHAAFGGARLVDFGPPPDGRRMGGVVVWDGFAALAPMDRQDELWRTLRARLSPHELRQLSLILTVTEDELVAITAD